ncbi:MAG: aminotransferase class III-fold pyridoxal phosphate-dependent enzyme [Planctomycetes bacterium]|nr:aminotransferase class III-fold pyridoxal phosphate-dependent enzyme [Planctomycetota bacterium]
MYDVIGDVHGHAEELEALLDHLGYERKSGVYRHSDRVAVFLGDWIDRGPGIRRTLEIVRSMVEAGTAKAVIGNHELNALAWATPRTPQQTQDDSQNWCRAHTEKNRRIHSQTLAQIPPAEFVEWLNWFRTLPWWLDLGELRCVHACWDARGMRVLREAFGNDWTTTDEVIRAVHARGSPQETAMECILKGPEVDLPAGVTLADPEGFARKVMRTRWFGEGGARTYADLAFPLRSGVPVDPLPQEIIRDAFHYGAKEPPVIVGHYWIPGTAPAQPLAPNVACVDYSVARGGRLMAYRWKGEPILKAEHFVSVPMRPDGRGGNPVAGNSVGSIYRRMTPATVATKTQEPAPGGVLPALAQHPAVRGAIDQIVNQLKLSSQDLTGAKPATQAGRETLNGWLERAKLVRARGGYYPYIGSGRGRGALVELLDGSVKWDMINGIGVNMFGHSDPGVTRACLEAAMADVVLEGNLQFNADSVAFAEFLTKEAGRASALQYCFVTNSGCMANEAALKICQQKRQGAPRVIAFNDCFMGRSVAMSQIGDEPAYRQGLAQNILVDYIPFYDPDLGATSTEASLAKLEECLRRYPGQHSCFVFELIQGEGGFNVAPREFFTTLMKACKAAGVPVWDDEVQTFGRTQSMFAFEALGLGELIDVATIGKISQACACLYTSDMNPKPGLLSGTFSASATSFHAGLSMLTRLRDGGFYGPEGRIAKLHAAFRAKADDLVKRRGEFFPPVKKSHGLESRSHVGGAGGMMRLTPFGGDKEKITKLLQNLFEDGVIAFLCGHGPFHLRFLPPIGVMEPAEFGPVFEILEKSLERTT